MAETIRLNKVLRELNISIDRAVDFLESKGIDVEKSPNTKISEDVHVILSNEFQTDANKKVASKEVGEAKLKEKEVLREQREREIEEKHKESARKEEVIKATKTLSGPKQVGKIEQGYVGVNFINVLHTAYTRISQKRKKLLMTYLSFLCF